jgi:hypothetical protein
MSPSSGRASCSSGTARLGVILDDKPSVLVIHEFRWRKAKRGEGKIRVRLEECE